MYTPRSPATQQEQKADLCGQVICSPMRSATKAPALPSAGGRLLRRGSGLRGLACQPPVLHSSRPSAHQTPDNTLPPRRRPRQACHNRRPRLGDHAAAVGGGAGRGRARLARGRCGAAARARVGRRARRREHQRAQAGAQRARVPRPHVPQQRLLPRPGALGRRARTGPRPSA